MNWRLHLHAILVFTVFKAFVKKAFSENVKRTEGAFEFLGTEVALAGQVSSVQEDSQGSETNATFFLKVHLYLRVDAVALNI